MCCLAVNLPPSARCGCHLSLLVVFNWGLFVVMERVHNNIFKIMDVKMRRDEIHKSHKCIIFFYIVFLRNYAHVYCDFKSLGWV